MKLNNANPASTWMDERLTLPCAVDVSCLFLLLFFIHYSVIHTCSNSVFVRSADAFSYDMYMSLLYMGREYKTL